jgi:hypothetical protein
MADDIIQQIGPHMQVILRNVRDVRGRRRRELNELVGQASESFILSRMYELMLSPFKITISRRTEKQLFLAQFIWNLNGSAGLFDWSLKQNETYEAMQGANNRTGRPVKKSKLAVNNCVSSATNGTCKVPVTELPTNEPPTSEPPTSEPPASETSYQRTSYQRTYCQ